MRGLDDVLNLAPLRTWVVVIAGLAVMDPPKGGTRAVVAVQYADELEGH